MFSKALLTALRALQGHGTLSLAILLERHCAKDQLDNIFCMHNYRGCHATIELNGEMMRGFH